MAALVSAVALGLMARTLSAGPWSASAAGFAWGVLALLRSNALLIGPRRGLAMAGILVFGRTDRVRGPEAWIAMAELRLVLSFLLGVRSRTFCTTRLYLVSDAYVGRKFELLLTTWQVGANFYIGNGPQATGTYHAPGFVEANPAREANDFAAEAKRRSGRDLSPGQVSRFWLEQGLRRWRDAPGQSVALLAYKSGLLAHDFEISDSQDQEFVRLVAAPALALGFLSFGWISPWAAVGLGRAVRSSFWWFLVLSTAAGMMSTAVFFVVGRYRIPWAPGLLLLGAAGMVDLGRRFRLRQWRAIAWRAALLMVPAAVLAWRPIYDPVPERWGHMLIGMALADALAGRLETAIDALDDARAFGTGPAERVEQLLAAGPLHDALGALIASRPKADRQAGLGPDSDLRRSHAGCVSSPGVRPKAGASPLIRPSAWNRPRKPWRPNREREGPGG